MPRPAPLAPPTLLALLLTVVGPATSWARSDDNGASGSPNFTARVRTTATAGEESTSPSFRLRSSMGPVTTGVSLMQSANFSFEGGIATIPGAFLTDAPFLFGVLNAQGAPSNRGAASGGDPVTLVGANFQKPGAGSTLVTFFGKPASGVVVTSDTTIQAVTPPGKDSFDTPVGATAIQVQNGNGLYTLPDGFLFTPAVVKNTPLAKLGADFEFTIAPGEPASLYLMLGKTSSGCAAGVYPLAGKLQLCPLLFLTGPFPVAGDLPLSLPLPPGPSVLIGQTYAIQSIAIATGGGASGSFTNPITFTLLP